MIVYIWFILIAVYLKWMKDRNIIPIMKKIIDNTDSVEVEEQAQQFLDAIYTPEERLKYEGTWITRYFTLPYIVV